MFQKTQKYKFLEFDNNFEEFCKRLEAKRLTQVRINSCKHQNYTCFCDKQTTKGCKKFFQYCYPIQIKTNFSLKKMIPQLLQILSLI